jgi:hypothetical protein
VRKPKERRAPVRAGAVCAAALAALLVSLSGRTARAAPSVLYDHGDPTDDEQLVLEIVNRARSDPWAEGTRLGIDITEGLTLGETALVDVKPPLAMNATLLAVARAHSEDMYLNAFFAHTNLGGEKFSDRILAAGYDYSRAGENIATGWYYSAEELEDILMVDQGVDGRGHRKNLLDIYSAPPFREVGIGFYEGASPVYITSLDYSTTSFLTQDFGTESGSGAFIVGVVYDDLDADGFYDAGEGLGGVAVTPAEGTYYAVTSASGGYAIPVTTSGTLEVTAEGGGLSGRAVKSVAVSPSGDNVKLDFLAAEAGFAPVADAGADVEVTDSDLDGSETVTLDGTASSDPDGVIVFYTWLEGATEIATGATASVAFAVGTHDVTLVVEDDSGEFGADQVTVTVLSGDADSDGLPDAWETANFGDLTRDGTGDYDSDGLTDAEEYSLGTNPTLADTDSDGITDSDELSGSPATDPLSPDTDSDGLTDGEEVLTYLTDPVLDDTDSDGLTDGWEVRYGFDPVVSDEDGNGTPDGQDDEDGDGYSNREEMLRGWNPLVPQPPPSDDSCGATGGGAPFALLLFALLALAASAGRRRLPAVR